VEEDIEKKDKAEPRQQRKTRRKFMIHGGSLRAIYPNAIRRRLREKK